MKEMIITVLIVISGICWSAVYVDSIRIGFKHKTFAMPLFALALNFAWEGIYSFMDIFVRGHIGAQGIANACWFILDIFILYTYFKFAKKDCTTDKDKKWFIPWTLLVIIISFALQFLFIAEFGSIDGEKYSAFLQNIVMSVCFLYMLNERRSDKGQTMLIAICKCIGTLTPTIYGAIEGNTFILVTGIFCFVFDVIYILALADVSKHNKYIYHEKEKI